MSSAVGNATRQNTAAVQILLLSPRRPSSPCTSISTYYTRASPIVQNDNRTNGFILLFCLVRVVDAAATPSSLRTDGCAVCSQIIIMSLYTHTHSRDRHNNRMCAWHGNGVMMGNLHYYTIPPLCAYLERGKKNIIIIYYAYEIAARGSGGGGCTAVNRLLYSIDNNDPRTSGRVLTYTSAVAAI